MPPTSRPPLWLLALLTFSGTLAMHIFVPALPLAARALGVGAGAIQMTVSVYILGLAFGQLIYGPLSDRFGRRVILLTGLPVCALAAVLSGLTTSFTTLLVWRLAHGVAAASVVVARSAIRDRYAGRQMARVMSLTFVVFLTAPILAPSL